MSCGVTDPFGTPAKTPRSENYYSMNCAGCTVPSAPFQMARETYNKPFEATLRVIGRQIDGLLLFMKFLSAQKAAHLADLRLVGDLF
jgi:hypothetical protein